MRPTPSSTSPEPTARTAVQRLRVLAPAVLLSLVAAVQLVAVEREGISRWRGGGMGMYSEFHPRRTELWALADDGPVPIGELGAASWRPACSWSDRAFRCTRTPTRPCLAALAECLDPASPVRRIEAWRPRFSPGDRVWSLERVAHVDR